MALLVLPLSDTVVGIGLCVWVFDFDLDPTVLLMQNWIKETRACDAGKGLMVMDWEKCFATGWFWVWSDRQGCERDTNAKIHHQSASPKPRAI